MREEILLEPIESLDVLNGHLRTPKREPVDTFCRRATEHTDIVLFTRQGNSQELDIVSHLTHLPV